MRSALVVLALLAAGSASAKPCKWTESPKLEAAPASGVVGELDGVAVTFTDIAFKSDPRRWSFEVRATKRSTRKGTLRGSL
jgi:hypothetical protein